MHENSPPVYDSATAQPPDATSTRLSTLCDATMYYQSGKGSSEGIVYTHKILRPASPRMMCFTSRVVHPPVSGVPTTQGGHINIQL